MSDFKYHGYTPMTDKELADAVGLNEPVLVFDAFRSIERAVLSRLKPDAEPVAYRMQYTYPNGGIYYVYAGKGDVDKLFSQYLTEKTPLYAHPPMNTAERVLSTELIERCAQRLAQWEDDSVWPDSWSSVQIVKMRRDAEKVLREAGYKDTSGRDSLKVRVDWWLTGESCFNIEDATAIIRDIRAYLVGGGK